jgi:hypothetical protein
MIPTVFLLSVTSVSRPVGVLFAKYMYLEAQGSSHFSQDVAFGPVLRPKAQCVCESELKNAFPLSKGVSHNFEKCVQSFCRTPRALTKYLMKHRGKFG